MLRDEFRNAVFERDQHKCVVCGIPAVDAHHIMERRLFNAADPVPFGYDIDNGASLCSEHHLQAESTYLSTAQLRELAGITRVVLPAHLDDDEQYTKWGDVLMEHGLRSPGELFDDESVQKIIRPFLPLYTEDVKHPRTFHLTYSHQRGEDDKTLKNQDHFAGQEVVVTAKMDGENTTMSPTMIHARSLTYTGHPSHSRMKALYAQLKWDIPPHMRICGENLFGRHTIYYQHIPAYFLVHSGWVKRQCLSWGETVEWAALLDLQVVPVLYRGVYDEKLIKSLYQDQLNGDDLEGFVVRLAGSFSLKDFQLSVAKYVDKPIDATHHWYHEMFRSNKIV